MIKKNADMEMLHVSESVCVLFLCRDKPRDTLQRYDSPLKIYVFTLSGKVELLFYSSFFVTSHHDLCAFP